VCYDVTVPVVSVSVPPKSPVATYALGAVVDASYTCSDSLSGVASCTGTVRNGAPINTTTPGNNTFKVTGTDAAGNATTTSITYRVASYSLSTTSLAFGNQAVNTLSAAMTVTLTNGLTTALSVSSIAISGTGATDFSQTNSCGSSVPEGQACAIRVLFKPTVKGALSATLTVQTSAGTQTVALTGTGMAAGLKLSPTSLAFGNVVINQASSARAVTVTNPGSAAVTIAHIGITGTNTAQFSETTTCGASVAAGRSCRVSLVFKPTSTGAKSATLNVIAGGGGGTATSALTGTGVRQAN